MQRRTNAALSVGRPAQQHQKASAWLWAVGLRALGCPPVHQHSGTAPAPAPAPLVLCRLCPSLSSLVASPPCSPAYALLGASVICGSATQNTLGDRCYCRKAWRAIVPQPSARPISQPLDAASPGTLLRLSLHTAHHLQNLTTPPPSTTAIVLAVLPPPPESAACNPPPALCPPLPRADKSWHGYTVWLIRDA